MFRCLFWKTKTPKRLFAVKTLQIHIKLSNFTKDTKAL